MAVALHPAQALEYIALLSRDIGSAAIVASDGQLLAGDPALISQIQSGQAPESLLVASSATHTIGVEIGPRALRRLLEHDLGVALKALA